GFRAREFDRDLFTPTEDRAVFVQRLELVARSRALRDLRPDGIGNDAIELDWGAVVDGACVRRDAVHPGDHLYVAVRNRAPEPLWVAIYNIGIDGAITLQTARNGMKLEPGAQYVLGDRFGSLVGVGPVYWPPAVPADGPRRESIVVVFADRW